MLKKSFQRTSTESQKFRAVIDTADDWEILSESRSLWYLRSVGMLAERRGLLGSRKGIPNYIYIDPRVSLLLLTSTSENIPNLRGDFGTEQR